MTVRAKHIRAKQTPRAIRFARSVTCVLSLLLIALHVPAMTSASSEQPDCLNAIVVRVVDGDTIIVNIPDYPPLVGHNLPIRVAGCDTPELREKNPRLKRLAYLAKQFTATRMPKGTTVTLTNVKRGKYFRLVANVKRNGTDLADELLQHNLAVPTNDSGQRIRPITSILAMHY